MGKLGTNKKCNHGEPSENCTLLLTPWRITLPIQGRMLLSLSGIGTCRVAFMLRSSIEATNGISEGAKFFRTLLGLGLSVSTIKRNYTTHRNLVLQQVLESKFKRSVSIVFDFATGTRSGQEPSYVRKNSQMASFAKNKMPNTTWKSYARKRNSTVHQ
jgi:hypothetical protein